jgi:hypothetical protein
MVTYLFDCSLVWLWPRLNFARVVLLLSWRVPGAWLVTQFIGMLVTGTVLTKEFSSETCATSLVHSDWPKTRFLEINKDSYSVLPFLPVLEIVSVEIARC